MFELIRDCAGRISGARRIADDASIPLQSPDLQAWITTTKPDLSDIRPVLPPDPENPAVQVVIDYIKTPPASVTPAQREQYLRALGRLLLRTLNRLGDIGG